MFNEWLKAMILVGVGAFALAGCESHEVNDAMEETGDAVEDAAEWTGDKVEEGGDEVEDLTQ